ncbi:PqqD family protein [Pedobacter sp. ASV28]|jgi:Coenzyme PQQ synthesis protein D (PqqD)|uniref:PqqD family protein n=1 Tax=Pedobacter sp. ASV28 TaxID=2795123 RepID=UPI0018EAB89D|nr:PqqD family protein [Pedobacter sp. ASV28]
MVKLKSNIATSENGFIFNPSTGDSYTSNPIAAEIIALLKNGYTADEIKIQLLEKYEVERKQLERDWDDYILQLREANLLAL